MADRRDRGATGSTFLGVSLTAALGLRSSFTGGATAAGLDLLSRSSDFSAYIFGFGASFLTSFTGSGIVSEKILKAFESDFETARAGISAGLSLEAPRVIFCSGFLVGCDCFALKTCLS